MYNLSLNYKEQRFFLQQACLVAQKSPDPSTQNGSVLLGSAMMGEEDSGWSLCPYVVAEGCNEFPYGVQYDESRLERPLKYSFIEHAERNSLFHAASKGIITRGLTMVCPWAACHDCARAIIQCGIYELVTLKPVEDDTNERWDSSINVAMTMLEEAGVKVTYFDGKVCDEKNQISLRRNGETWIL